jgi:hypothetical protein
MWDRNKRMTKICTVLLLMTGLVCAAQVMPAAHDNQVVVGNPSQPVQWLHKGNIAEAIRAAGPTGTVWIPGNYVGTDCNPVTICNPGTTLVIDLRGGQFQTVPALAGGGGVGGSVSSVFGRTGAVGAALGDYTAAQVGAIGDPGNPGIVRRTSPNASTTASGSDIGVLFLGCDTGHPLLGYDGNCKAGGTTGGGLADPGSNGIVLRTALNITTVANAAAISGLFGSCSGTQALGFDGNCHQYVNGTGTISAVPKWSNTTGSLIDSLFFDNPGGLGQYKGGSFGVGASGLPGACGTATGCFAFQGGNTVGTPSVGQAYFRYDLASTQMKIATELGSELNLPEFLNNGKSGQVPIANGDGTFTVADPNISLNTVTLFTTQAANGSATSTGITNPTRSGYGTLSIIGSGITGSPAGCSITLSYQQAASNTTQISPFATIFFVPGNGYSSQPVTPNSVGLQGDNLVAVYGCSTYPSAGTLSVSFNGAMPIAPAGSSLPMNIAQIGGSALTQQTTIAHDPSQTTVCSAQSTTAAHTLTISGLTINQSDTVVVGVSNNFNSSATVSSVTDSGGSSYSRQVIKNNGATLNAEIWGSTPGAAIASTSLTVNTSADGKFVACVSTYTGVQSYGRTAVSNETGTSHSISLNTQDASNYVFAVLGTSIVNTWVAGSGNLLAQGVTTSSSSVTSMVGDNTSATPGLLAVSGSTSVSGAAVDIALELRSVSSGNAALPVQASDGTNPSIRSTIKPAGSQASTGDTATVNQIRPDQPQLTGPLLASEGTVGSAAPTKAAQVAGQNSTGLQNLIFCDKKVTLSAFSTSGATQEIAASGSTKIYVCGWSANSAATTAVTVKLQYGTGSNCGTGTTDFTESYTLQALASNSPVGFVGMNPANVVDATPASQALCVNLSAAQAVNLKIYYAQF